MLEYLWWRSILSHFINSIETVVKKRKQDKNENYQTIYFMTQYSSMHECSVIFQYSWSKERALKSQNNTF